MLARLVFFKFGKTKPSFVAFKFETLEVWQEAVELTGIVHDVSDKFPAKELYVLTSQMKRAADSIALKIGSDKQRIREVSGVCDTLFC